MSRVKVSSMFDIAKELALLTYPEERKEAWGGLSKERVKEIISDLCDVDEVDYPMGSKAVAEFQRGLQAALAESNPRRRSRSRRRRAR